MPKPYRSRMTLYDGNGARKYINQAERRRFLNAANNAPPPIRTFCLTLAHTGCRISEALELTPTSIQPEVNIISIRCLKKRHDQDEVREVPVSPELIEALNDIHDISAKQNHLLYPEPLWPWGRTHAWKCVKAVMVEASIFGPHASPKGLRHGFCAHAVLSGVPITFVQKWVGHTNLETTEIYTQLIGPEEMEIAGRMW